MMPQNFKAPLAAAVLGSMLLLLPVSSSIAQNSQPPVTPEEAVRNIQDKRQPSQLSRDELRNRIIATQIILAQPGLPVVFRQRLIARQKFARVEMERRKRAISLTQTPPIPKVLSDQRRPSTMSVPALRNRIAAIQKALLTKGHSKNTRHKLVQKRQAANAELRRRNEKSKTLKATNFSVLADKRPPSALPTRQLRERVEASRRQLKRVDLPQNLRLRLGKKFALDKKELRKRMASRIRNNSTGGATPVRDQPRERASLPLAQSAKSLLRDRRHPNALNKPQLRNRIKTARNVLLYQPLRPNQRLRIKVMMNDDIAEKRKRLLQARDYRRQKLAKLRKRGRPLHKPKYAGPVRGDIVVAEADQEMLRRRLRAPDLRAVARRYTRNELVQNPRLTRRLPGIDVDTINFGFNEHWIREEEIDELERIAVEIERILALRPNEVFFVEGHTDAVGSDQYNKQLSIQRARAVKQALTSYFVISPQNLIPVGLGERYLKIPTPLPEAENRRVTLRRVTGLLQR